jgi:outer membrane protein OmpA-like peptidoglycan-associated protein
MNFTRTTGRFLWLAGALLFVQFSGAQIRLAAELGVHGSRFPESGPVPGSDTARSPYFSSRTGIRLGVLTEIPLHGNFYLQPGLNYSSKGNKYERFYDTSLAQSDTLYDQHTLKLSYVEIPLYLTYKIPLSKSKPNYVYLGAGPYFAFILGASQPYQNQVKFYNETNYTYQSGTEDLPVGNAPGKYRTLDIGVGARAGFELGNLMLGLYFSRGLSNAYRADHPGGFHNQLFGASLGIWINKAKPPAPDNTDSDGDGMPDRLDSCKTIAGLARYQGCPVPDSDLDGVNDEQDSCKTVAGPARYHGCPIPDTDGDGLNDEEDSCKTLAGPAKYHGCPVPDTDGDGVNDEADRCPNQPGSPENNGCPLPEAAPPAPVAERALFVARNVQFRSNSSRLTAGSLPALRELADSLRANPDLDLIIEGHTDNSGSPEYNQGLSEQRAEAVKQVLVGMGIPESRISTIGYGDTRPIGDNRTREGKAQNRRVVFRLHVKNS